MGPGADSWPYLREVMAEELCSLPSQQPWWLGAVRSTHENRKALSSQALSQLCLRHRQQCQDAVLVAAQHGASTAAPGCWGGR